MIRKRNLRRRVSRGNSNKRLYESIMRDVARTVKRHLNEDNGFFQKIQPNDILPKPILDLKKLGERYVKAEVLDLEYRHQRQSTEYKIEIGIKTSFEFYFTVFINVPDNQDEAVDEEIWDVYAYHTVEGLETEICEDYVTYDEFKEQVYDVIKNAIKKPSEYKEYCEDSEW